MRAVGSGSRDSDLRSQWVGLSRGDFRKTKFYSFSVKVFGGVRGTGFRADLEFWFVFRSRDREVAVVFEL